MSYTPQKMFTCCQRHMHAPQPRPRRLPRPPWPSPAALVSRPSAASSGSSSAGSLGSSSGSQPLNRRTGSERGWGKGLGQQCSRIGCVLQRASRIIEEPGRHSAAAPRLRRRAAELHVGGARAAGGRVAADVLGARARAAARGADRSAGGQRRRALFSSSLMSAEPLSRWSS